MSDSKIVLLTGASGFLGSHIASDLLAAGHSVRAVIRESKVAQIKQIYAPYGDRFTTFAITDIALDQFPPQALEGIYAVIHSAAPIPEKASPEEIVKGAVEGTLNVVRQAETAGVKRFIVTSSIATVRNPNNSFTDKDWNPMTKEQTLNAASKMDVYRGAKTLAEQELWAFADTHPHIDITTINPPFLHGPFAREFKLSTPNYYSLSTNLYIYRLLAKDGPYPQGALFIDVRDVSRSHVLALASPLSTEPGVGRKRLVMGSIYPSDFDGVTALLAEKRPELKDRLTRVSPPVYPLNQFPFDVDRLERVLGMKRADFKTFEETVLDAVDSLIAMEKGWIEKGFSIDIPKD